MNKSPNNSPRKEKKEEKRKKVARIFWRENKTDIHVAFFFLTRLQDLFSTELKRDFCL